MTILRTQTTVAADGNITVYVGKEWAGVEVLVTIQPVEAESTVTGEDSGDAPSAFRVRGDVHLFEMRTRARS